MSPPYEDTANVKGISPDNSKQVEAEGLKQSAIVHGESIRSTSATSPTSEQSGLSLRDKVTQAIHPDSSSTESRPWHSSWLRFGPLSGLFGLVLAAASLIASLGVLVGSDGEIVNSWTAPPSTYLAIFTAIANLSVRYSATQGVIIAWWSRARKGSTVAKLQSDWRAGTMLRGALAAGPRTGLLGLACIFATIVFIDGPLLQRASTVINIPNPATVPLNISMAPELPRGFTGVWLPPSAFASDSNLPVAPSFNATIPTVNGSSSNFISANAYPNRTAAFAQYVNSISIPSAVKGCAGSCQAKIRAPGLFPLACRTHSVHSDVRIQYNVSAASLEDIAPPLAVDGLLIAPSILLEQNESLNIITGFVTMTDDCTGTFLLKTCTFVSGIGEYDVLVENDQILMTDLANPRFVAYANNTAVDRTWSTAELAYPSTLGGVVQFLYGQFGVYVAYYTSNNVTNYLQNNPAQWLTFQSTFHNNSEGGCYSFQDPFDAVVNSMNKLMFYFGAAAAQESPEYLEGRFDSGVSTEAMVTGSVLGDISVYRTNYWFFLGAAVVEVVCIALILPTYWGWWKMGRSVSFSPFEMAKAFKSPLLADYNSNSNGNDVAAAAGERAIRYGVVLDGVEDERSQLGFGAPATIVAPAEGMRFDI